MRHSATDKDHGHTAGATSTASIPPPASQRVQPHQHFTVFGGGATGALDVHHTHSSLLATRGARAGIALRGAVGTAASAPSAAAVPGPLPSASAAAPLSVARAPQQYLVSMAQQLTREAVASEAPLQVTAVAAEAVQARTMLLGSSAPLSSTRPPTSAATSRTCGGVPGLRVLMVVGCDAVGRVGLRHRQLQSFSVSGCKSLNGVRLEARQLGRLTMERCDELGCVELKGIGVKALSLGGFWFWVGWVTGGMIPWVWTRQMRLVIACKKMRNNCLLTSCSKSQFCTSYGRPKTLTGTSAL